MKRKVFVLVFLGQAVELVVDVVNVKKSGLPERCHDRFFTNDSIATGDRSGCKYTETFPGRRLDLRDFHRIRETELNDPTFLE